MDKKEIKKYLFIGCVALGVMIIFNNLGYIGGFIRLIFSAMYPLILGCAIAFVFNIFLSFCERYYFPKHSEDFLGYSRRPVCLVFSIIFVFSAVFLIMKIVIPEVLACCKVLYDEIPIIFEKVKNWAIKNSANIPDIQKKIYELDIDWTSFMKNTMSFIGSGATGLITSVAGWIGDFTLSITRVVIAIIFAIYLLVCKDGIKKGLSRAKRVYLKPTVAERIQHIFDVTNNTFKKFFVGQFTEAIILGSLCTLGMLIFRFPYAAMTGTVIGVTALIPIVGAYIGAAVGAFMILTVNPMQTVFFLIFLVILQQIEGNFIYPKVVGSSIGLPGIWVLAAVTIGGSMFGIVGMLLGVPIMATVYKLVYENIDKKEREMGIASPPTTPPPAPRQPRNRRKRRNNTRTNQNRR